MERNYKLENNSFYSWPAIDTRKSTMLLKYNGNENI